MEIEQVLKRIDWLDDQRRKDRGAIAALEERVVTLDGQLSAANQQVQDLTGEITHLKAVLARVDQFDSSLSQVRMELTRSIDDIEQRRLEREREIEEVRRIQIDGVNNHLLDLRKGLEPIPEMQSKIMARIEEDYRLSRMLEELKQKIVEERREDETWIRSIRLLEESQRRDDKRFTGLQGEALALRKRTDEQRGRLDLAADSLRKLEIRVSELASVESDRRESHNIFFERQNLLQADRDRKWREWQARFETIEEQAMELESHLQSLHTAERDVRRAQEAVDAVIERVERRINEITEMQRLSEDRFRQEWVTFKADDQKRWTNYTLTQEEQSTRSQSKVVDRIAEIEDSVQELQDTIQQIDEQTGKRLQTLLAAARDWVTDYERVLGRVKV
ncbi:MAG: hypothetical protein ACE5GO_12785 [Anaerolineales bacterium]